MVMMVTIVNGTYGLVLTIYGVTDENIVLVGFHCFSAVSEGFLGGDFFAVDETGGHGRAGHHATPTAICRKENTLEDLSRTVIHAQAPTKALAWKVV